MPTNSFHDLDTSATLIAFIAGAWGAVISFMKRDIKKMSLVRKVVMFFSDIFVNIGLTMLTYVGLIGNGVNELMAVAIAGFIGHQGTRGMYLIELIIIEKSGSKAALDKVKGDSK